MFRQNERISVIRDPVDSEASIKDLGFTIPGLVVTVLCLQTATQTGKRKCLAETFWAESRERFMVLLGKGSSRNRKWGLRE